MEKPRLIALVLTRVQREYNLNIIRRLKDELKQRGMKLLVFGCFTDLKSRDTNDYGERSIFQLIPYDMLSGLIIQVGTFQDFAEADRIIAKAKEHGIPVMDLDHARDDIPGVVYDYEGAFGRMVRHVLSEHKCRKVYMIAGIRNNEYSENRVRMFYDVCMEFGIRKEETKVWYADFWDVPARLALREMLENDDLPEAIICANDSMALGAIAELESRGYSVPRDVLVTGMDGIMLGMYSIPRLTTITTDSELLCREAADMMERLCRGEKEKVGVRLIPMRLDLEESCGCPKKEVLDPGDKLREIENLNGHIASNEHNMVRMRHKLMDLDRSEIFDRLPVYLCGESWLCMNPGFWDRNIEEEAPFDYDNIKEAFDEELEAEIFDPALEPYERCRRDMFPAKELLPDLEAVLRRHDMIIFTPVNFQREVIGYFAFCEVGEEFFPFLFSQLCMSLAMILKICRNREQAAYVEQMLEQSNRVLYDLSIHDELTGLINRRGLMQLMEKICTEDAGSGRKLCYSYIDVDGFKEINDTLGHDEGDEVLRKVADALKRAISPWPRLYCSRIGGDEFVVFGSIKDEKEVSDYRQSIQRIMEELNRESGKEYFLELSIGQSLADEVSLDVARKLIREADQNMYRAKKRKSLKRKG